MNNKYKFLIFNTLLLLLVPVLPMFAQEAASTVEMADTLRQDGKIWIVVVVLLTVLLGLIAYLISVDRKVSRLEKQVKAERF